MFSMVNLSEFNNFCPLQEEISAPGSPARDRAADGEGDSIYDADTAPSAGGSGTPSEDSEDGDNEATQRAPGAGRQLKTARMVLFSRAETACSSWQVPVAG